MADSLSSKTIEYKQFEDRKEDNMKGDENFGQENKSLSSGIDGCERNFPNGICSVELDGKSCSTTGEQSERVGHATPRQNPLMLNELDIDRQTERVHLPFSELQQNTRNTTNEMTRIHSGILTCHEAEKALMVAKDQIDRLPKLGAEDKRINLYIQSSSTGRFFCSEMSLNDLLTLNDAEQQSRVKGNENDPKKNENESELSWKLSRRNSVGRIEIMLLHAFIFLQGILSGFSFECLLLEVVWFNRVNDRKYQVSSNVYSSFGPFTSTENERRRLQFILTSICLVGAVSCVENCHPKSLFFHIKPPSSLQSNKVKLEDNNRYRYLSRLFFSSHHNRDLNLYTIVSFCYFVALAISLLLLKLSDQDNVVSNFADIKQNKTLDQDVLCKCPSTIGESEDLHRQTNYDETADNSNSSGFAATSIARHLLCVLGWIITCHIQYSTEISLKL